MRPEQKEVVAQEMEFSHEHAFFYSEFTAFLEDSGFLVKQIRPKYFTYDKLIERVYGTSKPKTVFGKIKYTYFELMSLLKLNRKNPLLQLLQKYEDEYMANVPFNAICIKSNRQH